MLSYRQRRKDKNMSNKLFLLTAGTVAAGVAKEFREQIRVRKENGRSELEIMVRCIDTADLTPMGFLQGEWMRLSIENQFMDGIHENPEEHYPELEEYLYPGDQHLPETTSDGGGGIRYNGAGAIILNRDDLQKWIKNNMDDLASMGDGNPNFSVALLVSAVGATGSGILERLIECVIGAIREINTNEDPHCDVFILQPGTQRVTDLGLANTVALFAETTASRLAGTNTTIKRYKGRTILVGWGTIRRMDSIQQLQETAATLIRLINDPITEIAAEYRQRAPDVQAFQSTDPHTHLPANLSAVTAVTIGLGSLEEQIISRDTQRLLQGLVYGDSESQTSQEQVSVLQSAITGFLSGDNALSRYQHLLDRISEGIDLSCESITRPRMERVPAAKRASQLESEWKADKELLAKEGRRLMKKQEEELSSQAVNYMINGRRLGIATHHSLIMLKDEYEKMLNLLDSVLDEAQEYIPPPADKDEEVYSKLKTLDRPGWFGGRGALENALSAVQDYVRSLRLREANPFANQVLHTMKEHCLTTIRDLSVIIHATPNQRSTIQNGVEGEPAWEWNVVTDHPFHIPALSRQEDIDSYYHKVSIFSSLPITPQENYSENFLPEDKDQIFDPLSDFRRHLQEHGKLDILFGGNFEAIFALVHDYTWQGIHAKIGDHSVIGVLLQAGEHVFYERLNEAASKAYSLVSFSPNLASKRFEVRHISAYCKDDHQRRILQEARRLTIREGECTFLESKDPTELVVFYYVDGLPMSALRDLTGRCLKAFQNYRRDWYLQAKAANKVQYPDLNTLYLQSATVSVYNGRDTEELVQRTGVIQRLYQFREKNIVPNYREQDIPELDSYHQSFVV
jgi:hypothetical protein